jgi:TonB family protein
MKEFNNEQIHGLVGTIIVHIILLLILLFVVIDKPAPVEEEGVPVVMGNIERAKGDAYNYTEVKVAPQPAPKSVTVKPTPSPADPLITQTDEETVTLNSAEEKKKDAPKKPEKTPEQLEQERKAQEAERKRQEAEKMAREANAKIAGAFGKGTTMTDKGVSSEGSGNEGSVAGNETSGATKGVGGYGSFDLSGRQLVGSLPVPTYNTQEEGRVVVTITVAPNGRVVNADINKRTNTTSAALRQAALKAARQAVFSTVSTVNNQMGTITYYFKLK